MNYELCYYYVDNNTNFKFSTLEKAKEFAKEISKELHYYPSIYIVVELLED